MGLYDQISKDIMQAMKDRDKVKLEALRGVKKEFIEAKTSKGADGEMSDETGLKILQKLVKQREESAAIYRQNGRNELAEAEEAEMNVIKAYLPQPMNDAELTAAIKAIIEQTGAASVKEMGKVMGIATKQLAGKADGKAISDKVKQLLA